jgi:threonine dehydrogenase-like Zn-dependent dehydrogenase
MTAAAATRTRTMRAASLAAPGRAVVERLPVPQPGPGEVLFRVEGCGVCGSSLPAWEGREWFGYPLAAGEPGHEAWGVVEAVGAGADVDPGTPIAALSTRGFAEYDVAPAEHVVPLPPALAGRPFPGEALGCAVNVVRRSRIEPGHRVAVVGAGFIGLAVAALAADAGAHVTALSRRPFALDLAREIGCEQALTLAEAPTETFDRVVEASGVQETLDLAGRLTRERGLLAIAGYHQDGPRLVDLQLWNWRGLDVVNAHERDPAVYVDGIRQAAELVAAGRLDPTPLLTHTFGLDEVGAAFEAMRTRPDGFLKALVTP